MRATIGCGALFLALAAIVNAQDKGYCPSTSPPKWALHTQPVARTKAPTPEAEYVGEVRVRFVISNKGYVCVAQVIQSLNDQADEKALAAVQRWRFEPAYQGDRAVPALSTVSFFYWRDSSGRVVATHVMTPLSSLP